MKCSRQCCSYKGSERNSPTTYSCFAHSPLGDYRYQDSPINSFQFQLCLLLVQDAVRTVRSMYRSLGCHCHHLYEYFVSAAGVGKGYYRPVKTGIHAWLKFFLSAFSAVKNPVAVQLDQQTTTIDEKNKMELGNRHFYRNRLLSANFIQAQSTEFSLTSSRLMYCSWFLNQQAV